MKKWLMKHKKMVAVLCVAVILVVAAVCILPRFLKKGNVPEERVKQNTINLTKMDLTESVSATGTVESAEVKYVTANVSNARIQSVKVSVGDTVKKGQKILAFDTSDLKETLAEAKENLADTKSQVATELSSVKRKLSDAQETYQTKKNEAQENISKAEKSRKAAKKTLAAATTPEEVQKAKEALEQAETALTQAKNEKKTTTRQNRSEVESAKEQLQSTKRNNKKSLREAEKSVSEAEDMLSEATVTSPIEGVVTALYAEEGETYTGGNIAQISNCEDLEVTTTVTEYDIAKVKKGQRVVILTDAAGDEEISGEITYVAVTVGSSTQSSGDTGNAGGSSGGSSSSGYEVRIALDEKNDTLRVGMTARCSIILEEVQDVFAVPYDAIHSEDGSDRIYVMDSSGQRTTVDVTVGMESDYYVEIQGDELSEDLQVIIPSDTTSGSKTSDEKQEGSSMQDIMGAGSGKSHGDSGFGGGFGGSGGRPDGAPGM